MLFKSRYFETKLKIVVNMESDDINDYKKNVLYIKNLETERWLKIDSIAPEMRIAIYFEAEGRATIYKQGFVSE